LKDIRRRIGSVKKTQQITRAMRMVAGAKLRRAQNAIEAARPYSERMRATLAEVAASGSGQHALLESREAIARAEIVVVTSDRGLCGAFNANVLKQAERAIAARKGVEIDITTAGRKATDYFKRRYAARLAKSYSLEGWATYGKAAEIAGRLAQRYRDGEVDEVVLIFSQFVSALTQTPRELRLLPFSADAASGNTLPYTIEPNPNALLATLVPRAVEVTVFRALLENQAGEHAARMSAMESATRNTEELIGSLTLKFNRARQAAITKELVEIVSGAEAL
jgi:F-type H+-transporting ATPase subunit gamma